MARGGYVEEPPFSGSSRGVKNCSIPVAVYRDKGRAVRAILDEVSVTGDVEVMILGAAK